MGVVTQSSRSSAVKSITIWPTKIATNGKKSKARAVEKAMKLVPVMATYENMKWPIWWIISKTEVEAIKKLQVPARDLNGSFIKLMDFILKTTLEY